MIEEIQLQDTLDRQWLAASQNHSDFAHMVLRMDE